MLRLHFWLLQLDSGQLFTKIGNSERGDFSKERIQLQLTIRSPFEVSKWSFSRVEETVWGV